MTDTEPREIPEGAPERRPHAGWVRFTHWIAAASLLTLGFSGFVILMAHPRLYWGEAGNDLTPPLFELPISPRYLPEAWTQPESFGGAVPAAMTASRTYEPFNQNGWARSLHFLAGWWLVIPGLAYLLAGLFGGHFRRHVWPRARELAPATVGRDLADHLRFRIPPATGGPDYGPLQKIAYTVVVFGAAPLMLATGLAMAPAVTGAFPSLLDLFGGYQSARTLHFFSFMLLLGFVAVHLTMVVKSGFRRQLRSMTLGE
jgi:thiosulfate reductase cytochrome b subunit